MELIVKNYGNSDIAGRYLLSQPQSRKSSGQLTVLKGNQYNSKNCSCFFLMVSSILTNRYSYTAFSISVYYPFWNHILWYGNYVWAPSEQMPSLFPCMFNFINIDISLSLRNKISKFMNEWYYVELIQAPNLTFHLMKLSVQAQNLTLHLIKLSDQTCI